MDHTSSPRTIAAAGIITAMATLGLAAVLARLVQMERRMPTVADVLMAAARGADGGQPANVTALR